MRKSVFLCVWLYAVPVIAAEPVALTYNQAVDLATGLASLDGYDKPFQVAGGPREAPRECSVKTPYNFSGITRRNIGRNLAILREATNPVQFAVGQMRVLATVDGKLEGKALADFNRESRELGEKQIEPPLELWRFKVADFRFDENQITGTTISQLGPILDDK